MKIFGIFIIGACVVANIILGVLFYNNKIPFLDSSKAKHETTVDLASSPMVLYRNSTHNFSFMYPKVWALSTLPADRAEDPNLIDLFASNDATDNFYEGFYVHGFAKSEMSFDDIINGLNANLEQEGSKVINQKNTTIDGLKAYEFMVSGTAPSIEGEGSFEIKNHIVAIDTGDTTILLDFSDQISTFDETDPEFIKVVNSFKSL